MQSGKPVGVFRTHADAPRVLIANSNLVPHWATWDQFHELDRKGLMMYGQMTAGSWIYIGSQGIVQGTYETFVEVGRRHYGGDLAGRWILTGGLGGMGGAQPLAATMAGASLLAVECQASRIEMRLRTGYLDREGRDARRGAGDHRGGQTARASRSRSGCSATPPTSFPELVRRGMRPDVVTDQTSAHDPINGYLPKGWTLAEWEERRERDPKAVEQAARRVDGACTCGPCSTSTAWACRRSTTATTSARWRWRRASPTPSTFPASCRPISGRCSAGASGRSAGRRCRAIPRTSTAPTRR